MADNFQISGINAAGTVGPFGPLLGGNYILTSVGTWTTATSQLQVKNAAGSFVNIGSAISSAGTTSLTLPNGTFQIVNAGTTFAAVGFNLNRAANPNPVTNDNPSIVDGTGVLLGSAFPLENAAIYPSNQSAPFIVPAAGAYIEIFFNGNGTVALKNAAGSVILSTVSPASEFINPLVADQGMFFVITSLGTLSNVRCKCVIPTGAAGGGPTAGWPTNYLR